MKNPFKHWQRKKLRQVEGEWRAFVTANGVNRLTGKSLSDEASFVASVRNIPNQPDHIVTLGSMTLCQRQGLKLLLDCSSLVDENLARNGTWEQPQIDFLSQHLAADSTTWDAFIDIGSYWGLYSMVAVNLGIKQVIAFEPDRYNFAQLQAQLFLNNMVDQIDVRHYALSNTDANVDFSDSRAHPTGNRGNSGIAAGAKGNTYKVAAHRGDAVLPFIGKRLAFKIDVEGHEAAVLQGLEAVIRNNTVLMQIEIFEPVYEMTAEIAKSLGLKKIHQIEVDHYFTNARP